MTLLFDELYPMKPKKKKKVEELQPVRRKVEIKRSKKEDEVIEYNEPIEAIYCICRLGLMN